jgi:hypothetical protein
LPAGTAQTVLVRVRNDSAATWPAGLDRLPLVRLGHRWHTGGHCVEGPRTALPCALAPGAETLVPVHLAVPEAPRQYRLEIGLVHEGVTWFGATAGLDVHVLRGERWWTGAGPAQPARRSRRSRLRVRRTGYLGWTGYDNAGDEAVYEVARARVRSMAALDVDAVRAGRVPRLRQAVLGGGTIVGHSEFRSAIEALWQRYPGLEVEALAPGVEDPAYRPEDAAAMKAELERWIPVLERMRRVTVRGPHSQELLAELGFRADVTGDPALLLGQDAPSAEDPERVLALNAGVAWRVRGRDPDRLLEQLAEVARATIADGWRVRLVSVWPRDVPYLEELRRAAPGAEICDCRTPSAVLDALRPARVAIGMKLHAVVMASALLIPSVMLAYQPKCDDFMASLDLEDRVRRTDELVVEDVLELVRDLDRRRPVHRAHLAAEVAGRRAAIAAQLEEIAARA